MTVRRYKASDLLKLPNIEMDAGEVLRAYGLETVADMPVDPHGYNEQLPEGGTIFVAVDDRDEPVGFALCIPVDGEGHLKELSVSRSSMKQGLGTALLNACIDWAKEAGFSALTLTTYRDIPFNAPYYTNNGFEWFEPDENWPELCAIREDEKKRGLDIKPRLAMKLNL